jgi:hypothetical protein
MAKKRTVSAALHRFFYWTGVVLSVACPSLVLAKNYSLLDSWQGPGIPWSWVAGLGAVLAFVTAELCHVIDESSSARDAARVAESASLREAVHQEV